MRRLPALVLAVLALGLLPPVPAVAQDGAVERIAGETAVEAAAAISRARFPGDGSARLAVLANDVAYADALAGAVLTGPDRLGLGPAGPLLLTDPDQLDQPTAEELERVLPAGGEVIVLGGDQAISALVTDDLGRRGYQVRRLAGETRFETAVAIADEWASRADVDHVLLARGDEPAANPTAAWADAISGSATGLPILLSPQADLHPAARTWIAERIPGRATLLGGELALSAAVAAGVPQPVAVDRIAGPTRDGTAAAVAQAFDLGGGGAVLVDGFAADGWAYGLPGATLARDTAAALLPVSTSATAEATARFVACGDAVLPVVVIGSAAVVPDAAVQAHRTCPPDPEPPAATVVLRGDGLLPDARIGDPADDVVAALQAVLGPPTGDTGVVQGCPLDGEEPNERTVEFGDLRVSMYGPAGEQTFLFWSYPGDATSGLQTDRGLGAGATNADVASTYPEATLVPSETFGPYWDVPPSAGGPLVLFPEGTADADRIDLLFGGDVLFCD